MEAKKSQRFQHLKFYSCNNISIELEYLTNIGSKERTGIFKRITETHHILFRGSLVYYLFWKPLPVIIARCLGACCQCGFEGAVLTLYTHS